MEIQVRQEYETRWRGDTTPFGPGLDEGGPTILRRMWREFISEVIKGSGVIIAPKTCVGG